MELSSSKNPKKKRRVDEQLDSEPGPSSQVLPLVAPHLVPKSSKDPNRGMYPFSKSIFDHRRNFSSPQFFKASDLRSRQPQSTRGKPPQFSNLVPESTKSNTALEENFSSPQFVKASELRRRMPRPIPEKTLSVNPAPESTNSNSALEEHSSLGTNVTENGVVVSEVKSAKKLFNSYIVKGKRRSKFTHIGAASKITKYFKNTIPSKPQTVKAVASCSKSQSEPSTSQSTRTSAWMQKDESMSETLAEINNEQFFKNYQDCYGLVDNSVPENAGEDYFSILPTHIIESILCQIPILDLMACRLVCSRWCEIIDRERVSNNCLIYYMLIF